MPKKQKFFKRVVLRGNSKQVGQLLRHFSDLRTTGNHNYFNKDYNDYQKDYSHDDYVDEEHENDYYDLYYDDENFINYANDSLNIIYDHDNNSYDDTYNSDFQWHTDDCHGDRYFDSDEEVEYCKNKYKNDYFNDTDELYDEELGINDDDDEIKMFDSLSQECNDDWKLIFDNEGRYYNDDYTEYGPCNYNSYYNNDDNDFDDVFERCLDEAY